MCDSLFGLFRFCIHFCSHKISLIQLLNCCHSLLHHFLFFQINYLELDYFYFWISKSSFENFFVNMCSIWFPAIAKWNQKEITWHHFRYEWWFQLLKLYHLILFHSAAAIFLIISIFFMYLIWSNWLNLTIIQCPDYSQNQFYLSF